MKVSILLYHKFKDMEYCSYNNIFLNLNLKIYINKKHLNIKVVNLKNQLNFVILITFMLNTIIINKTIFIYHFTYSFKLIPIIR